MTDPKKIEAWGSLYTEQRKAQHPGWTVSSNYELKRQRVAEALEQCELSTSGTFLELGCGAGNTAIWMASKGFKAYGIDIVPEAIQWAKQKAADEAITADFYLGDLSHMTMFGSNFFDLIFDADCLQMIVDESRSQCLGEILRILKPGGIFIAGGNVRDEGVSEKVEFAGGKCYFDPQRKSIFVQGEQRYLLLTERELCDEFQTAGFNIIRVNHHSKRGSQRFVKECIAIHATKKQI